MNHLPRFHPVLLRPVMEEFVKLPQSGNTGPFLSFGGQPQKRGCMFLGLAVPEWERHRSLQGFQCSREANLSRGSQTSHG